MPAARFGHFQMTLLEPRKLIVVADRGRHPLGANRLALYLFILKRVEAYDGVFVECFAHRRIIICCKLASHENDKIWQGMRERCQGMAFSCRTSWLHARGALGEYADVPNVESSCRNANAKVKRAMNSPKLQPHCSLAHFSIPSDC
jgi:hypothetical protein